MYHEHWERTPKAYRPNQKKDFYKSNYWDPIQLDLITSQRVAEEIFDTAVNMGVGTAVKFAYEACGLEPSTKVTTELINTLVKIKS